MNPGGPGTITVQAHATEGTMIRKVDGVLEVLPAETVAGDIQGVKGYETAKVYMAVCKSASPKLDADGNVAIPATAQQVANALGAGSTVYGDKVYHGQTTYSDGKSSWMDSYREGLSRPSKSTGTYTPTEWIPFKSD